MKTGLKLVVGFLAILGILGYIFKSNIVFYYVILPLFGLLISYLVTEAKNNGKTDVFTISIWVGSAALILSGIILMFFNGTGDVLAVTVLIGILAFMVSFFSYIGMEEPKDERLKKIGTMATTHSWYLTLLIIGSFLISSIWSGKEYISVSSLGLILLVMVSTMFSVNVYFNTKGDVE